MNILVIDQKSKDGAIINALRVMQHIGMDLNIFVCDYTLEQYSDNNIDFVIVDFSEQANLEFLNKIIKLNPNQKTITLSDTLACSEQNGCDYCVKNYHRKRLLKPVNVRDLDYTIKNFDTQKCKYYNSFSDITTIIPDIMKRFLGYKYNSQTKIISQSGKNDSMHTLQELSIIISILNQHDIKYNVINETDIQLV